MAASEITIMRATAPDDDVRLLVAELDRELSAHYPPEQRHGLNIAALFQPHVRFFVARIDAVAVGCGGVALFADFAELKRMYVRPAARGRGVADAILARLAAETADAGLSLLRLETGTQQMAAIRFYRRSGFRPCPLFEPYASMPPQMVASSVAMEKALPLAPPGRS